jgi:hypothetical protein
MDKLIIASADGHAAAPPETWSKYLDKEQHRYLQRLRDEHELFSRAMGLLHNRMLSPEIKKVFDKDGIHEQGWQGVWDLDIRLREMDREGVATEFVFAGDHHAHELFWNVSNGTYAAAAVDAGARAFNRWSHDTFSPAPDRLLRIGAPLSGLDFDAMLAEAAWMGKHGFTGVFTPGYTALPGLIPIYESYWDPLWSAYVDQNLVLVSHAGWGMPQGYMFSEVEAAAAAVRAEGGGDEDLMAKLHASIFNEKGVFADLRSRQSMWQLMLGGVFDRHPKLKIMMTEIRADWLPATLKLLDKAWEDNRDRLPAKRRPSEYWRTNCMAGLSFMNRAEMQMRAELGVETIAFGRDYPHTEATWPNTIPYLSDIFRGVSEQEVRDILGENLIRFLGLDRAKLAAIAERIGPSYRQIADGPGLDPALKDHLNMRCGYSNPSEGASRIPEMAAMLKPELPRIAAAGHAFQ